MGADSATSAMPQLLSPCYRPNADGSVDPNCFLSIDGDQMVFGFAHPPHFLLSMQLSHAQTMLQEGGGSLQVLPPQGTHPHLPGCRTCGLSPTPEVDDPRRGWAHTQHPSSLGRAMSKSRWKSLRTLNSPDSFSSSCTPSQPPQVSLFK